MSLRLPIPKAIRDILNNDPAMKKCMLASASCHGRIQFHHYFTYAGKRQNEVYGILSCCYWHHVHEGAFREEQEAIMQQRIKHFGKEEEFKEKYPKRVTMLAR